MVLQVFSSAEPACGIRSYLQRLWTGESQNLRNDPLRMARILQRYIELLKEDFQPGFVRWKGKTVSLTDVPRGALEKTAPYTLYARSTGSPYLGGA